MKIKAFHGTRIANVDSIKEKGLVSKFEGVYLTDSLDSACRWVGMRLMPEDNGQLAVVEVEVEEDDLEEGVDHSPMMVKLFGVGKSLVSPDSIPPEQIVEIHYFQKQTQ